MCHASLELFGILPAVLGGQEKKKVVVAKPNITPKKMECSYGAYKRV
ncbi:hypothetical protein FACS1894190_16400 [Spirochaetia bacterium]|nr:hypothetical protein FACS1894190_16400 [Spirochaetia bacterium]